MNGLDICAVIVTYNRLEKLKKALAAYDKLSKLPDCMIIVDNGSTDGTKEYLRSWQQDRSFFEKKVISLNKNTGGSGGFYEGIKQGCQTGCQWIWVADDDAYPQEDCFEILAEHLKAGVAAACARVNTADGIDTWHRRRLKKGWFVIREERINEKEYHQVFELDLFSYVGTMLSTEALKDAGMPEKDFFINYDDTEHSMRMRRQGKILCVPSAVVYHDSRGVTADTLLWKKFYAVRNKLYSYKKHFGRKYAYILSLFYWLKAFVIMIKKRDVRELRIVEAAVKAGNMGELGVDAAYCPGWR
ncbi:MAG: glycosyltransferase [Alistipes sp.]|nr:glycosyltransferase [Alistipes sp.]